MLSTPFVRIVLLLLILSTAGTCIAQEASRHYEKAVQAYHEGEYSEAFIHLQNALQADPGLVSARILLAQLRFNAGDIGGAEKESEEALLLGADINLVLPIYGPSLVLQEKTDELFELEEAADSFTPDSQFEWALLKGQGYLLKGERTLARSEFERAVTLLPENARSNNTLAALYMNSGMDEEARALIEKSLILEPRNPKTWELRGELAFKDKQYNQALEYYLKGFDLDDENLRIQRALAQVYLQLGNREEVRHYIDLILEQSPKDPAATLISAILLIGDGDTELGDKMLANLSGKLSAFEASQQSSDDSMLFLQASAEYVRGNDSTATSLFNAYLSRNKSDIAAIRLLVDLYLRNGEIRQATALLNSRESLVLGDTGLSIQLLNLSIRNGEFEQAQALLERVKKNGAGGSPYVVMLEGELFRARGQPEKALALLDGQNFEKREPLSYSLLRGALQLQLQQYPAAQKSAQHLQKAFPDNVSASNFAAVTYLALGKLEDAEIAFKHARKLAPENVDAQFNQAMLYKKRNELGLAQKILKGLIEEHPDHTKAILLMARILFLQGKSADAIEWSNKVYAYDSRSNTPAELQLEIYSETGDWQKARSVARQLSKDNPLDGDYLMQLAVIDMELKDKEQAQATLHKLYTLWEQEPDKLRQLAAMQLRAGNIAEARRILERGLTLDPNSYSIQLELIRLNFAEDNYAAAESAAQALQKEVGQRTELAFLRGEIALAREQPDAAQTHFMRAFQLDGSNTEALAKLYQLSVQGVGAKAFTDTMEATLKESSLSPLGVRLLADSYLAQGETARASVYYEKLLTLEQFAADPAILNNLANIYAATDLDKALVIARKGLKAEGEQGAALLDTVGWILSQQGQNEEALSYLRKAYAKNSRDPEIRYHIGATLLTLGRTAEAETELRAALAGGQQFTGRDEAQRLLSTLPR